MAIFSTTQKKDVSSLESDLDTLTENMKVIAGSVDDINEQVDDFKEQFDQVKANIDSIEKQIKNFMIEVRGNTYVSNARIELENNEEDLNKKYGQYDFIRNKLNEIVNNLEKGSIEKNKLLTQSEQTHLSDSNYYLTHSLIAICAWLKNERKLARKAINKALSLDDNKTSLLFSMFYLKLDRKETAIKWLKRYLSNQDATNMNSDILGVINLLSNEKYDNDVNNTLYEHVNSWVNKAINDKVSDDAASKWEEFFRNSLDTVGEDEYTFSKTYVKSYSKIKRKLELCYSYNNVYSSFLELLSNVKNDIDEDKIFHNLIYDYGDKELELRRNILKCKLIIECNGDLDEAESKYKMYDNFINTDDNFYTELNDAIINRKDLSLNTKKLAISLCKNDIIRGYEKVFNNEDDILDEEFEIKINEWTGTTKDGSNEKELQDSLVDYVRKPFAEESQNQQYYSPKTIYSAIFVVVGIILTFIKFYIGLTVVIVGGCMLMFFLLTTSRNREDIIKDYNDTLKKYMFELNNVLAEIVDMKFICKKNLKYKNEFTEYIESFDKKNYIDYK